MKIEIIDISENFKLFKYKDYYNRLHFRGAQKMNNDYIFINISNQLKRIADALEESNKMVKDLGGK